MTRPLLSAAALALLAASPALAQRDSAASALEGGVVVLSGRVVDAGTGRPLRAARVGVTTAGAVAFTDSLGGFSIPVPAGAHSAFVGRPGYMAMEGKLTVAAGDAPRTIRLPVDSAMMAALHQQDVRLARRARASGTTPQLWERDALVASDSPNVAQFLLASARMGWTLCGGAVRRSRTREYVETPMPPNVPACVRTARPGGLCVIVDEQRSSMYQLTTLDPRELYRLEAYRRAGIIVGYSTRFVEWLARRGRMLPPLEGLVRNLCG
ncbi:MAG TPA: hypothetical protein VF092_21855 [Longimicrobium sp.]